MVVCLERGADLHIAQMMPLPLTVSCFNKIQIGFTFWYRLTRVVPDKGPLNGCVCVLLWFVKHLFHASSMVTFGRSVNSPDNNTTTTTTHLQPLYRSTSVSQHLQLRTGGFSWCKVLLPACNQRIRIREKTLEFSTVLSMLSPYCTCADKEKLKMVVAVE